MKTALLTLCFTFVLFTKLSVITGGYEPVFDVDGEGLRAGQPYYIFPGIKGRGGGLTLFSGNNSCPLQVVQQGCEIHRGKPVTFLPAMRYTIFVRPDTDLNIKFDAADSICDSSNVWRLVEVKSGLWFVGNDGVEGNPGADTIINWFKITETNDEGVYNVAVCPKVCSGCQTICGELGIYYDDDGKMHLALGDGVKRFPVVFKRYRLHSPVDTE